MYSIELTRKTDDKRWTGEYWASGIQYSVKIKRTNKMTKVMENNINGIVVYHSYTKCTLYTTFKCIGNLDSLAFHLWIYAECNKCELLSWKNLFGSVNKFGWWNLCHSFSIPFCILPTRYPRTWGICDITIISLNLTTQIKLCSFWLFHKRKPPTMVKLFPIIYVYRYSTSTQKARENFKTKTINDKQTCVNFSTPAIASNTLNSSSPCLISFLCLNW